MHAGALTVYTDAAVEPGREAAGLLLAAMLASFALVRLSTRLQRSPRVTWWPGSVETRSGVHVHHLVFGIVTLLVVGFLSFAIDPEAAGRNVLAILFGIGAGLTLDEFALWLYLKDVYWSEQGRLSVDAVVLAALAAGLFLVAQPLDIDHSAPFAVAAALWVANVVVCSIAFMKGKFVLGLVGLFFPVVADVAAIRLARPSSPWSRWFYGADGRKMARAHAREVRWSRRRTRWTNLIGGAPSADPSPAERPSS